MVSFKVLGLIGLSSYAAAYLSARLSKVAWYRYQLIALPVEALPDLPRGYTARLLDAEALAAQTIDIDRAAQADRFARGLRCLAAFDRNGALAGVTWLGRGTHSESDLNIRYALPANAAWDTGLWVPEEKRMGRAFAATWGATKHWLRREGLEWTMSSIADYNIPSLLSHRRLGSRPLGHVCILRIGRLQITPGARPLISIVGRSATPVVRLKPV